MNNEEYKPQTPRRQLFENGYSPLPNRDKACYLERWPTVNIDEQIIKRWDRMGAYPATGLRVENGLCVIDVDIDHRICDDVCEEMLNTLPESLTPERLERTGKGHKIAWYCRTDELFTRLHSRKWVAPGGNVDDAAHCVEIFGGGSPRQFGSFGPHSHDDDGNVKVTYKWVNESPLDVPLNALTVLTKSQLMAMIDAAEGCLQRAGFEPVARTKTGESASHRIYDLTPDMIFHLADGDTVQFAELSRMVKEGYSGRCSASWLEGPTAVNRSRCLVSSNHAGYLSIWESSAGTTHLPSAIEPQNHSIAVDRAAERIKCERDSRKTTLIDGDDAISGAAKLLKSYAFLPDEPRKCIVPLWASNDTKGRTIQNMRIDCMPYCTTEIGPRGGEKKINPVDVWLANAARVSAGGLLMRPDMPCPTFEYNDRTYINTYRAPNHLNPEQGNTEIGLEFMEQLVPDQREREWFLDWLAYKWQNPHIPGPALIMVARGMGTGRGTFGDFLSRLFIQQFVTTVPFKIFAGMNYQSQYTDWGLNKLFCVVNESSSGRDVSAYQTKHELYEHLKEMCDPRPTERMYVSKEFSAVTTMTSMSTILFTNNIDCIPLPRDDRRFAVLTNGEPRGEDFWKRVNLWINDDAGIAAFAQMLADRDTGEYNPYGMPLMTRAKEDMIMFAETSIDRVIKDFHQVIEDNYFTVEHALGYIAERAFSTQVDLPKHWKDIVRGEIHSKFFVTRTTANRLCRPSVNGHRVSVFCDDKINSTFGGTSKELRAAIMRTDGLLKGNKEETSKVIDFKKHMKEN